MSDSGFSYRKMVTRYPDDTDSSFFPKRSDLSTRMPSCIRWRTFINYFISIRFNIISFLSIGSRDSVVGIATGYGLDDQEVGVRVPVGSRVFSSPHRPHRLWGPPSILSNGYRGFSWGVKRPRREVDHSPPTSAEVNKTWIHTSTPPFAFMA
jgi:hypothetical protein